MNELIKYPAMIRAIAACHTVDEVKDIRDKAVALHHYAKQAMNLEAERKAIEIRIRAERKAGQLMREMEKVSPAKAKSHKSHGGTYETPYQVTLSSNKLTKQEASRWQQLAKIPEEEFEERLTKQRTISTRGLVDPPKLEPFHAPQSTMFVWGWLCDFDKRDLTGRDPADVYAEMSVPMQRDIYRLCPAFVEWMTQLGKAAHHDTANH